MSRASDGAVENIAKGDARVPCAADALNGRLTGSSIACLVCRCAFVPCKPTKGSCSAQVAFFVNSGSEANDLAMKMARLYSGNYDFLALRNGYHGKRGLNAHSTWRYNMPQVLLTTPDLHTGRHRCLSIWSRSRNGARCWRADVAWLASQGFGVHYLMNPDPYRGPFGNDGAAYAAQVDLGMLEQQYGPNICCTHAGHVTVKMSAVDLPRCRTD